jgi:hypothetical protein
LVALRLFSEDEDQVAVGVALMIRHLLYRET